MTLSNAGTCRLLRISAVLFGLVSRTDALSPATLPQRDFGSLGAITELGTLGGASSAGYGINDSGFVVGASLDSSGQEHAFIWSFDSAMRRLAPVPGASFSSAQSVNNTGVAVGWADAGAGVEQAVRWGGDSVIRLGSLDGSAGVSRAYSVSETGIAVGYSSSGGAVHAVRWSASATSPEDLGVLAGWSVSSAQDVNESGVIAGFSAIADGTLRAVVWAGGSLTNLGTLPGGTQSSAWGINDAGAVAGFSDVTDGSTHAFLWTADSGMRDLGVLPGGTVGVALGINDFGEVIGYGATSSGAWRAFRWTPSGGMESLLALQGGGDAFAAKLNNVGYAVGDGFNQAGQRRAIVWDIRATSDIVTPGIVPALAPTNLPDWVYYEQNLIADTAISGKWIVRNTLMILFKDGTPQSQRQSAIELANGQVIGGDRVGDMDGAYYVYLGASASIDSTRAAIARVAGLTYVEYAQEVTLFDLVPPYRLPHDSTLTQAWRLSSDSADGANWALEYVGLPYAWGCETGDSSVG